jgi:hypothetical protein
MYVTCLAKLDVVMCMGVTIEGLGLVIGFIEHLQLVNTSKDCALIVLHTSHITIVHTRFFIVLESSLAVA